jgi:hypothetical protein
MLAYFTIAWVAPKLPVIEIKRAEAPTPTTLQQAISLYLTREPGEQIEMVQTNYDADWDTSSEHLHYLYDLGGIVPSAGDRYAPSDYLIEANYESFLLSIRPSSDPHYQDLVTAYERTRSAPELEIQEPSHDDHRKKPTKALNREQLQEKALEKMIIYLESTNLGPTAPRLGKALRTFYGQRQSAPYVTYPSGNPRNLQRIETVPDLADIRQEDIHSIPTTDFIVPATSIDASGVAQVARAQTLRLVELALVRPWLDLDLLISGPHALYNGSPPNFFGPTGTLARIPVRIVLVQEPEIDVASAKVDSSAGGKITIGPFSFSGSEVGTDGGTLHLKPQKPSWVVLAIVSKEI